MSATNEHRIVCKAMSERTVQPILDRGVAGSWFFNEQHREALEFILKHQDKYGNVPTRTTFETQMGSTYKLFSVTEAWDYLIDVQADACRWQSASRMLPDVEDALKEGETEEAVKKIREWATRIESYSPVPTRVVDSMSNDRLDERWEEYLRREKGGGLVGMTTGFPTIDETTLGLQPGHLVTILAQPKVGKTTLSLAMANHVYVTYEVPVLFVSFEMSIREMELRQESLMAGVNFKLLQQAGLPPLEKKKYYDFLEVAETTYTWPFHFMDASAGSTVSAIRSQIERYDPGLVLVDGVYMLVDEQTGEANTPQALTNITRSLKRLASHTARPIIINTQALAWKSKGPKITMDSAGYCVDDATEILTTEGWKTRHTVSVGDTALTLNHETGQSEWQRVDAVNVFPAMPRLMLRMQSKNHSSLTTMEHRWPVLRRVRTGDGLLRDWSTSGSLKANDRIIQCAPHAGLPEEPVLSDALVELIAWFWTEGQIDRYGRGAVSQSSAVNASNVDRIRSAFLREYGAPTLNGRTAGMYGPMWRESPRKNRPLTEFWFNKALGSDLLRLAPDRVPTAEFLMSLTRDQLELFLEVSFLADGHNSIHHSGNVMSQRSRARAESFHLALILSGRSTGISWTGKMWRVSWRTSDWFNPIPTWRLRPESMQIVEHTGHVWCPTTRNGTWFARRGGKTYFTGNSSSFAQDSDVVLGLERMKIGKDENDEDYAYQRILRVLASRNTGLAQTELIFDYDTGAIEEAT